MGIYYKELEQVADNVILTAVKYQQIMYSYLAQETLHKPPIKKMASISEEWLTALRAESLQKKTTKQISIVEFDLPKPDNYESLLDNADRLFAELLIRYHLSKKDFTKEEGYGKLVVEQ